MTFSPPPPPGTPGMGNAFNVIPNPTTMAFSRRPKIWVPPMVAFGAFTAGYAIPWEFGESQQTVIMRVVLPLLISAIFCLIAGFYTYRTLPGWRTWTWASFGFMFLNAIHTSIFSPLASPLSVQVLLWTSAVLLGLSATLGQEDRPEIHNKPTISPPGVL